MATPGTPIPMAAITGITTAGTTGIPTAVTTGGRTDHTLTGTIHITTSPEIGMMMAVASAPPGRRIDLLPTGAHISSSRTGPKGRRARLGTGPFCAMISQKGDDPLVFQFLHHFFFDGGDEGFKRGQDIGSEPAGNKHISCQVLGMNRAECAGFSRSLYFLLSIFPAKVQSLSGVAA